MENLGLVIAVATVLIALLGLIFGMLKHFETNMNKRFDKVDAKFDNMDAKFDQVNRQIFALAMNLRPHLVEPTPSVPVSSSSEQTVAA